MCLGSLCLNCDGSRKSADSPRKSRNGPRKRNEPPRKPTAAHSARIIIDIPAPDCHNKYRNGDIAQLGERCLRKAEAGGSNPLVSTRGKSAGHPWKQGCPAFCSGEPPTRQGRGGRVTETCAARSRRARSRRPRPIPERPFPERPYATSAIVECAKFGSSFSDAGSFGRVCPGKVCEEVRVWVGFRTLGENGGGAPPSARATLGLRRRPPHTKKSSPAVRQ